MTEAAVQDELLKHTKIKPKAGETAEAFTARVIDKVNKMADDTPASWGELTEDAQKWVNTNVTAQAQGSDLQLLALEAPPEEATPAEESEPKATTSTKERSVATKKAKTNGAAKKAPPAAKKAPVAAKAAKGAKSARGRKSDYNLDAKITVVAEENPHRKGSKDYDKFKKLKSGMTVAKAAEAVGLPYVRYLDKRRELIKIAAA